MYVCIIVLQVNTLALSLLHWIVTGVEVSTLRRSVEVLPSWLRTWPPLNVKTGNGSGGRVSDGYLVSASVSRLGMFYILHYFIISYNIIALPYHSIMAGAAVTGAGDSIDNQAACCLVPGETGVARWWRGRVSVSPNLSSVSQTGHHSDKHRHRQLCQNTTNCSLFKFK